MLEQKTIIRLEKSVFSLLIRLEKSILWLEIRLEKSEKRVIYMYKRKIEKELIQWKESLKTKRKAFFLNGGCRVILYPLFFDSDCNFQWVR